MSQQSCSRHARWLRPVSVLVPLLLFTSLAHAATLQFVTPNATVGPNDPIEVWVRLSTTTDIVFDGNNADPNSYQSLFPPPPPWLPQWPGFFGKFVPAANGGAGAFVTFDTIVDAITNNGIACTGSFYTGCSSSEYTWAFNLYPDPDAFAFRHNFTLLAGQSRDFHFGTFTPKPGGAAPGTYDFAGVGFFYLFTGYGTDDFGVTHFMTNVKVGPDIASICSNTSDPSCTFTRQVQAVPVPAAVWLLASALGLLGTVRRLRQVPSG